MTSEPTLLLSEDGLEPSRHRPRFPGVDGLDAVVVTVVLLLVVAFAPPLMFESWMPRFALLTAVLPLGLVVLVISAGRRDSASMVLLGALCWTALAAFATGAPRSALFGFAGRDLSTYVVVGASGVWALGREMSDAGRRLLSSVVIWSIAGVALLGFFQVAADVQSGPLALVGGRPTGLMTNPVYFGAICATGTMAGAAWYSGTRRRFTLGAAAMSAVGVSLSGSRVAMLALVGSLLILLAFRRQRSTMVALSSAAVGVVIGFVADHAIGSSGSAADRLTRTTWGGRTSAWRYGLDAALDRPIVGYGFGRFRPAVQSRFTAEFIRSNPVADPLQPWFDAHNIVIGTLVAVGLVGTILFSIWAAQCVRLMEGLLAWALLPLVAHWMLQPLSLYTLPLAMALCGASMPPVGQSDGFGTSNAASIDASPGQRGGGRGLRPPKSLGAAALSLGLLAAAGLVGGDAVLRVAVDDADAGQAAKIGRLTLYDPIVSDIIAQVSEVDPDVELRDQLVLRWRVRTVEVEPDRPYWWSQLAMSQIAAGEYEAARTSLERAFDLQEHSVSSLQALAVLAIRTGDVELLETALQMYCTYGLPECELSVDELLTINDG